MGKIKILISKLVFRQIKLIEETFEGDSKNMLIKQLLTWSIKGIFRIKKIEFLFQK